MNMVVVVIAVVCTFHTSKFANISIYLPVLIPVDIRSPWCLFILPIFEIFCIFLILHCTASVFRFWWKNIPCSINVWSWLTLEWFILGHVISSHLGPCTVSIITFNDAAIASLINFCVWASMYIFFNSLGSWSVVIGKRTQQKPL